MLAPVSTCDHDAFHSGQGRYSPETGELRYVVVCDACQAELRVLHAERYRPNYNPHGNDRHQRAA